MEEQIKQYIENARKKKLSFKSLSEKLIKTQPNCCYCGVKMKLYSKIRSNHQKPKGFQAPDDMVTVEHLYSKWDIENRYKIYPNDEDKILACYKCNHSRGNRQLRKIPNELMRERTFLASKWKKDHPGEPRILGLIENTQKIFEAIRA